MLSKTSPLGNFLPTGTLLTFEMVLPSIYNNGECSHVYVMMIHFLLFLCAIFCFFFHFTHSFHGLHSNLYYGFVTPTGLSVLKSGLLDVVVPKDHMFRLTIISATVFLAIVVSNHRITNCLFRQNTKT
ncbi:hypothetical protein Fmac_026195 [Flemingia macrophylla]|uniref:Uncharacterized protein n=1 Tax=Flemingia macrophylla TaxID=520843 RepID=A0ABD1LEC7_9FABA